jgi:hypothetical protein
MSPRPPSSQREPHSRLYAEGGFGVTFKNVTKDASFYTTHHWYVNGSNAEDSGAEDSDAEDSDASTSTASTAEMPVVVEEPSDADDDAEDDEVAYE